MLFFRALPVKSGQKGKKNLSFLNSLFSFSVHLHSRRCSQLSHSPDEKPFICFNPRESAKSLKNETTGFEGKLGRTYFCSSVHGKKFQE